MLKIFEGFNIRTEQEDGSMAYIVTTHSTITHTDLEFVLARLHSNNHVALFYQTANGVFTFMRAEYSTRQDAEEAIRCHLAVMEARGII